MPGWNYGAMIFTRHNGAGAQVDVVDRRCAIFLRPLADAGQSIRLTLIRCSKPPTIIADELKD
jgi:hypothetical protein